MSLKIGKGFELPVDVLTEAIGIVATRGAGKTYASVVLIEEAAKARVPFVVIDATSVYHGLRSSADGESEGLPVYVFGGRHGDLPLEDGAGALMADVVIETGHSFVLDVSDFTRGVARRFVSAFLTRLYERKARERSPLLLVIDEADEWAPQKPNRDSAFSLSAMELIVKRGRSRGLGAILITQRTQALNKDVLDLIETLFAMRQLAERSRDAVKGWIADKEARDELGVIDSLPSLPTGTAWVWSPLRGILERVEIRRIRTFDSYGTVKPGEADRSEPAHRVELDLEALGERMAATVTRARENDPKTLRARVIEIDQLLPQTFFRESTTVERVGKIVDAWQHAIKVNQHLEAQLAVRTAEIDKLAVRTAEVIEVPAISAEQLEALHAAADAAVSAVQPLVDALANMGRAVAEREGPVSREAQVPSRPSGAESRQSIPPPRADADVQASRSATANGKISKPQQKILDALAWFKRIGVTEPRRSPLAAVAGASPKSSGFEKNVSTLRTAGLIEYPQGGRLRLTSEGEQVTTFQGNSLGLPDAISSNEVLHEAIYRMVSGPQAALLRELILAYPDALEREELAVRAGVSAASSGFEKNVSTLKSFELVDYPQRGEVRALEMLFPLG